MKRVEEGIVVQESAFKVVSRSDVAVLAFETHAVSGLHHRVNEPLPGDNGKVA